MPVAKRVPRPAAFGRVRDVFQVMSSGNIRPRVPAHRVATFGATTIGTTLGATTIGVALLLPVKARAGEVASPQAQATSGQSYFLPQWSPDMLAFVPQKLAEWKVVLGGGAMISPKYEGSDEFKVSPVPFLSATFGDTMRVDPRGVSVNFYKDYGFSFAVRAGYDLGRSEDDSDHLRGLGDIGAGGVIGARLAYEFGPLEIYTAINRIVGGSNGLEGKFGADLSFQYERFLFMAGVSGTWADSKYMETYFGVTPLQSALSGLPVYDVGAGIKRMDVSATVTYMATEHWVVRGQAGWGYLLGDAGDSPIVQDKSQPYGLLSLGYRF